MEEGQELEPKIESEEMEDFEPEDLSFDMEQIIKIRRKKLVLPKRGNPNQSSYIKQLNNDNV